MLFDKSQVRERATLIYLLQGCKITNESIKQWSRIAFFDSYRSHSGTKPPFLQDFLWGLLLFMRFDLGGQNRGEDIRRIMILKVISYVVSLYQFIVHINGNRFVLDWGLRNPFPLSANLLGFQIFVVAATIFIILYLV